MGRILEHWKRFPRDRRGPGQARVAADALRPRARGLDARALGLGHINEIVAARAKAFGMRVLATRRSARPGATAPDVDELFTPGELEALLGQSDAVVAAVPETVETTGLMNRAAFAAMKPGSFFCNVGRGSLVDEPALVDALRSGHLSGAALDVASVEPLPPDHILWDAPNLRLSPHCSTAPDGAVPQPAPDVPREPDPLPGRRAGGGPGRVGPRLLTPAPTGPRRPRGPSPRRAGGGTRHPSATARTCFESVGWWPTAYDGAGISTTVFVRRPRPAISTSTTVADVHRPRVGRRAR